MRPLSACTACRDRRKRCDRPRQGTSCTYCTRKGLKCAVEERPTPAPGDDFKYESLVNPRTDGTHPIAPRAVVPDRELCDELVRLYFRHIHITFHNLFHPPLFRAAVRDGSIPKILLFAVFSLSARFSSHPHFADIEPQDRGRPYAREAERLLDLHKTCLATIQACVLLGAIQVVEMDSATESIFYTIACRLALILNLPDAPAETRIEQEVNLRVWWSVVATDTWSSTALGLPRAIQPRYDIPMPMDEREFHALPFTAAPNPWQSAEMLSPTGPRRSTSLIGRMIKLNAILYEINTFNTAAVSGEWDESRMLETVAKISTALDEWHAELPDDMQFSLDSLRYWAGHGCGPSFVVLHINYNHASQLLFYRFLHSSLVSDDHNNTTIASVMTPTASTTTIPIPTGSSDPSLYESYATRCRAHATALCETIYAAARDPLTTEVLHPLAGHMLVVSSTVHLHTLLFSSDAAETTEARGRLEQNFNIITRLRRFWPSLKASFSRLETFHRACLRVGEREEGAGEDGVRRDGTFRLDRWMVRFLLDFAKPVDERDDEDGGKGRGGGMRSLVWSNS